MHTGRTWGETLEANILDFHPSGSQKMMKACFSVIMAFEYNFLFENNFMYQAEIVNGKENTVRIWKLRTLCEQHTKSKDLLME